MKEINGINVIEISDLINDDQPHYWVHKRIADEDYICSPRFNIRFRVKESDLHMPIPELVERLNDGSIKFNVNFGSGKQ